MLCLEDHRSSRTTPSKSKQNHNERKALLSIAFLETSLQLMMKKKREKERGRKHEFSQERSSREWRKERSWRIVRLRSLRGDGDDLHEPPPYEVIGSSVRRRANVTNVILELFAFARRLTKSLERARATRSRARRRRRRRHTFDHRDVPVSRPPLLSFLSPVASLPSTMRAFLNQR